MMNAIDSSNDLLIIDDDEVLRELLPILLDPHVNAVHTADCGDTAVELLSTLPPDRRPSIILADLRMPGLPPAELAERLRRLSPPSTRLIAMSGSEPPSAVAQAFDAFLLKPFGAEDFIASLQDGARAPSASPAHSFGEPLSPAIFHKLLTVMGEAQLSELYSLFLDDAATRITRMSAAALDLDAAYLVREAHGFKGSCGMLGATELHNLAGQIEAGALQYTFLLNDFAPALDRLRRMLDELMAEAIGAPQEVVQS